MNIDHGKHGIGIWALYLSLNYFFLDSGTSLKKSPCSDITSGLYFTKSYSSNEQFWQQARNRTSSLSTKT